MGRVTGWVYYIFLFFLIMKSKFHFRCFAPSFRKISSRYNTECLKLPKQTYLPWKISTELSAIGLLQKVSKVVFLVHGPLFNISGKIDPTCWALDAEAVLVECPVNMLGSILESLWNSLSQRETLSTDSRLCGLI